VIAGNPIISYSALSRDVDKDLITAYIHAVIIETVLKNLSASGEMVFTELTLVINCKS
jgi:hypothetical protein